jgi:hypothetical protein
MIKNLSSNKTNVPVKKFKIQIETNQSSKKKLN